MSRSFRDGCMGTPYVREVVGLFLLLALAPLFSGCIANVRIPSVDRFHMGSGVNEQTIDAERHGKMLLDNFYRLLKANEGVEVPVCTAAKDSRQCLADGFTVFVWGGFIPGAGGRSCYVFREISQEEEQITFTKDNRTTTFIGTPMYAQGNACRVSVKDGGLQVQMDKYYANWMGVGQMFMAEGWAIDFMDLRNGVVGLHMELDIKGILTIGGGSRYLLLKFPHVPEAPAQPEGRLNAVN